MKKNNHEEYEILKSLDNKWKWIARDGFTGIVNVYEDKPRKIGLVKEWTPMGDRANKTITKGNLFQFIQWEDPEPYNISELIEEHESEETEVKKDIEWAKKEIKKIHTLTFEAYEAAVIANNKHFRMKNSERLAFINKVLEILDQLDEPELPEIPDYVAEELEEYKNNETNYGLLELFSEVYHAAGEVEDWIFKNQDIFIRAWLDGYTVEEKKYYVIPPHKDSEGYKMYLTTTDDGELDEEDIWFNTEVEKEHYSDKLFKYKFTKEEVKKIEKGAYWAFAVPVEELEE